MAKSGIKKNILEENKKSGCIPFFSAYMENLRIEAAVDPFTRVGKKSY